MMSSGHVVSRWILRVPLLLGPPPEPQVGRSRINLDEGILGPRDDDPVPSRFLLWMKLRGMLTGGGTKRRGEGRRRSSRTTVAGQPADWLSLKIACLRRTREIEGHAQDKLKTAISIYTWYRRHGERAAPHLKSPTSHRVHFRSLGATPAHVLQVADSFYQTFRRPTSLLVRLPGFLSAGEPSLHKKGVMRAARKEEHKVLTRHCRSDDTGAVW